MSILSRLHKIVNASAGATKSLIGFSLGLPPTSLKDDEYDSLVGQVFNSVVSNVQNVASSFLGPSGVSSAVTGAVPSAVRNPVSSVTGPATRGLETAYREGISEPLSTYFTTLSMADQQGGGALLSPNSWSQAYRIAQHRSPGQALAIGAFQVNPTDEAELAKFVGTDQYKIMSGTVDALSRTFLDPTVLGGKAIAAARAGLITKALHTPEEITAALSSNRVAQFNDAITAAKVAHGDNAAAYIRDRFFPDHDAGAQIATVLAEAKTPQEQWLGLRALMGDTEALPQLDRIRSRLHEPIASLNRQADQLGPIRAAEPTRFRGTIASPADSLFGVSESGVPGDIAALREKVARYYDTDARAARMQAAFGTIREAPRARLLPGLPALGDVRTAITRSDFYQNSSLGKSLQTIFAMNAHPVMSVSDQYGDIQLDRLMSEAELPRDLRDTFRTEYMRAPDDQSRLSIALNAEKTSIAHLADRAGMTQDELQGVLNDLAKGRGEAQDMLTHRVFNEDGTSILTHQDEMGEWVDTVFPPWITQESTLLPLVNMRELKAATTSFGQFRSLHPSVNIPEELANKFTRLWKPAVLLRPAWPIRVVGDEQLRILAKIGALSHLDNLQTGFRDYTTDFISTAREKGIGNVIGRSNRMERQGFGVREFNYKGYDMEGVFGTPDDIRRHVREMASASDSWHALVGNTESAYLRQFREIGQNFKSVLPDHPDYPALYNWAAERLRDQPIARRLLAGESPDDIITFLHSTPEGTDILAANTVRAHNTRNWVEDIAREVDKYTVGNDELRAKFLDGTATHDDLVRLVPDISARPIAHGELLNQSLNKGFVSQIIPTFIERTFDKLGRLPTDTLSRNPFMGHMYRAEVKRRIDILGDAPMSNTLKAQIEDSARNYSLNETRKLLYDLAESSRLGEMLNFLSPFYNAWQEVITRWTGLAIENPAFAARARLVWQAPEKAGMVTDEQGRTIKYGDTYSDDPAAPNYRGKDRLLTLPLPSWVKDIPGMKGVAGKDSISFNKKSFNLVLQGFPSVGPLVQIPVNQIVKDRPELADNVKAILPFGPTHNLLDMVLPSSAKYFLSAAEEDQRYSNVVMRIYTDKVTDFNLGKRDTKPTWEEAKSEADKFTHLRAVAAMVLPAAPIFHSPYQMQIDAFRQAQARYAEDKNSLADEHGNPRTPDEWFLDTHGKEYFALTQAVSKSMDGIPPTLESYEARKKYQDLVEKYPELGGLIIGASSGGEFNAAVYAAQLANPLRPGSDKNQREPIPFEEAATDPDRRLGWIEYRRAMDLLESTRIQRGLPNMQVAAAKDLAAAKAAVTAYLSAKYPAWKDDFNQTDKGKWENKISALREISSQPEMSGRPDMQGIRDYLTARDQFSQTLADRKKSGGPGTLSASGNQDLAEAWNTVTGYLIERNLAFADVFYRHLENDPLGL